MVFKSTYTFNIIQSYKVYFLVLLLCIAKLALNFDRLIKSPTLEQYISQFLFLFKLYSI